MKRKMKVGAGLAMAGALAGTLLIAQPASATVWDCINGYACGWIEGGWNSVDPWHWATDVADLPDIPNDDISSIANRRTVDICWYTYENYLGLAWCQGPAAVADLAGNVVFNDSLSAVRAD